MVVALPLMLFEVVEFFLVVVVVVDDGVGVGADADGVVDDVVPRLTCLRRRGRYL